MKRISTPFAILAVMLVLAIAPVSSARERHPEIRAALDALRAARGHLASAAHDYHGHRVAALQHTDEAIREAEECMHED